MKRAVLLFAWVAVLAHPAVPRACATSVPMWLAVQVTHVDTGITTVAVGDRFAIALVVNDSVLDQNSSIGGGQFPGLISSFMMKANPANTGTWLPSGTFNLPASNFVTNAFGNGITFQVRGTGFPSGGPGLPFFDVDLGFPWLGDITDSGLGDSFAQQLGATFDPTRAVLGGSGIRFGSAAQAKATVAVASNFSLWSKAGIGDWTTASNWRPHGQPNSSTDANISNGGTVQITAEGAQARDVFLGELNFGGLGHLKLLTPVADLAARNIFVGEDGTGTLTIEAGGSVSNTNGTVGREDDSSGTVTVTGAGSIWTNNGDLSIGDDGTGELTIDAGGSVSNNIGVLALSPNSTGTANISGSGSHWSNGSFLVIGGGGAGNLTVAGGGSVSNTIGVIGTAAGSTGTVVVTGMGSTWTNSSRLGVGDEGTGTLAIKAGGHVSNTDAVIGFETGSSGTVQVTGTGSTWTMPGPVNIGSTGTGSLAVLNGGSVTSGSALIRGLNSGSGQVIVSGAGSTWNVTNGTLTIGKPEAGFTTGPATLTIDPGATVTAAQNIDIDINGTLRLQGGTLDAKTIRLLSGAQGNFEWTSGILHVETFTHNITNQGGTLAPGHSAGTTTIVGSYTQQNGAALEIEIGGNSPGSGYDVVNLLSTINLGMANLAGELRLALLGGFVPSASSTFTVLTAPDGILGAFSNVANGQRLTTINGSGSFLVHYGPGSAFNQNQVVLSSFQAVLLPGDYNGNGVVDGADYVVWRKNKGLTGSPTAAQGNGDGDNDVDDNDYAFWRARFGNPSSGAIAGAAVPEPATGVLLLSMVAGMSLRRRTAMLPVSKLIRA